MDYSLLVGIKRRNFEVIDTSPTMPLTKSHLDSVSAAATAAAAASPHGPANPLARLQSSKSQSADNKLKASTAAVPATPAAGTGPYSVNAPVVGSASKLNFTSAFKDPDGAMHAAVVEGQGTFYIGIIDILQEWNYDKWYERMFKKYVLRKDASGLSAMDPLNYRKRFYQRAVLDVFDGLAMEDADDGDIFERPSMAHFPGEPDLRDTVDTTISSRGRGTMGTMGDVASPIQSPSSPHSFRLDTLGAPLPTDLSRESASESSSFSHEVQLQSFQTNTLSNASRDLSRDSSNNLTPTGTDRRFAVKCLTRKDDV